MLIIKLIKVNRIVRIINSRFLIIKLIIKGTRTNITTFEKIKITSCIINLRTLIIKSIECTIKTNAWLNNTIWYY